MRSSPFACSFDSEGRESVFLPTAAGLVRKRHFGQSGSERGQQVGLPEVLVVFEPQGLLQFQTAHLAPQHLDQPDFRGDFRVVCQKQRLSEQRISWNRCVRPL